METSSIYLTCPGCAATTLLELPLRPLAERVPAPLSPVEVRPGTIGLNAREIGGASLPLFANFAMDLEVLFTEA